MTQLYDFKSKATFAMLIPGALQVGRMVSANPKKSSMCIPSRSENLGAADVSLSIYSVDYLIDARMFDVG